MHIKCFTNLYTIMYPLITRHREIYVGSPRYFPRAVRIFFPKTPPPPRDISQLDGRNDHRTPTNQRQPTRVNHTTMSARGNALSTDINVGDRKDTGVRRGGRLKEHAFPDGCDSRHDRRGDRKNVDHHHREEKDGVPKFLTSLSKSNAKDSIMLVNYLSLP